MARGEAGGGKPRGGGPPQRQRGAGRRRRLLGHDDGRRRHPCYPAQQLVLVSSPLPLYSLFQSQKETRKALA
uniref:Uncharacterized protein n=1 Tax=Arundo donax TaxID=35708 RepID=A0A0A9ENB2_ARUDO